MFIDSHAHLTSAALFEDLEAILDRAKVAQVEAVVNICTDIETLEKGLELSRQYPWIFNTAATTPHDVERVGELHFEKIAKEARQGKLVAVGETGLDYYYNHSDPKIQKDFLSRYLRLAVECSLPVVIHCRDAFKDFFEILDQEYICDGKHLPGVLHCFTGVLEEAYEVLKRGWYLSLSGIVTFKKSDELRQVARMVPLEQLLIETDSPYLAPQKFRGKQNEPSYLPETAALIAKEKGVSLEELAQVTANNARQLFCLTESIL